MSYIYSENGDINFRYQASEDDTPKYISISALNDYFISGGFRLYGGYWDNLGIVFKDVNNINVCGIANTTNEYTNLPSDSDGWGTLVNFYNINDTIQLFFGWNLGHLWYRLHHGGYEWGEWNDITELISRISQLESYCNAINQQVTTANGNIDWLKYNIKSAELNTDNNIQFKWRDGNIIICVDWEEIACISRNI